MIVADTNVVSEFMRDEPDSAVLAWAGSIGPSELTICVLTVEEIERGVGRLSAGKRRAQLEQRWRRQVATFREAILAYDVEAAKATAQVAIAMEAAGRPMSLADAQIAGICLRPAAMIAPRRWSLRRSVGRTDASCGLDGRDDPRHHMVSDQRGLFGPPLGELLAGARELQRWPAVP